MNQKLANMMKAIRTVLEDDSCRRKGQDLLHFVSEELLDDRYRNCLAWRILREFDKPKPKTIRERASCFDPHDYGPIEKAAKIMGVKLERLDEPPF